MGKVRRAYRFALDPTSAQERALRSHAGAARFAWNWGLARCRERYAADRKWYSAVDLHKMWNAEKKSDPTLDWWAENSKCCYQEAFRNLDRALRDFVKSKRGERKGKRLGFPRFKKRGKSRDSFRLTGVIRCAGTTVTLPRLGVIATHESTQKLADRVAGGGTRIMSATVSRTAQRWFVSFTVEEDWLPPTRHTRPGTAIGIDLGVKALLTSVDVRDRGGGGAECVWDDPQPSPGPRCRGPRLRHHQADAGLQNGMAWRDAAGRRQVLPLLEDLLGLRHSESQAVPARPYLSMRSLPHDRRPGRKCRPEPAQSRRQWGGEPKRQGRDGKTTHRTARPAEPGTRHTPKGQDRDRRPVTGGCGMGAT
jgi:helix-turn-helix protein